MDRAGTRSGIRRALARAGLLLCGAVLAALAACVTDAPPGSVGEPAPEFAAATLDGDTIALADLRGRAVLLNVWATWCPPCREETPDLQALYEANRDRGLEVVGVSIDNASADDTIREFVEEYDVTYTILHDPRERVSDAFRIRGVPTSILIGPDGVVRWQRVGQVRPEEDAALQEALDAALAEAPAG